MRALSARASRALRDERRRLLLRRDHALPGVLESVPQVESAMSDARSRDLERRAGYDPAAAGALLRECARRGDGPWLPARIYDDAPLALFVVVARVAAAIGLPPPWREAFYFMPLGVRRRSGIGAP